MFPVGPSNPFGRTSAVAAQSTIDYQSIVSIGATLAEIPKDGVLAGTPLFMTHGRGIISNAPQVKVVGDRNTRLMGLCHNRASGPEGGGISTPVKPAVTVVVSGLFPVTDHTGRDVIDEGEWVVALPHDGIGVHYKRPGLPTGFKGAVTVALKKLDGQNEPPRFVWQRAVANALAMVDSGDYVDATLNDAEAEGMDTFEAIAAAGGRAPEYALLLKSLYLVAEADTHNVATYFGTLRGLAHHERKQRVIADQEKMRIQASQFVLGKAMQRADPGKPFAVLLSVGSLVAH